MVINEDITMTSTFILVIVIVAIIIRWIISIQHKLIRLDENIHQAMNQIGIQLSGRFDALTALLYVTKIYAQYESEILLEAIQSQRSIITAKSNPEQVMCQELVISETLDRIAMIAKEFPELKTNQTYNKARDAVEIFGKMIRTSHLLYNDCVMKLNREIRMFPVSFIVGMLGVREREYLEEMAKSDP